MSSRWGWGGGGTQIKICLGNRSDAMKFSSDGNDGCCGGERGGITCAPVISPFICLKMYKMKVDADVHDSASQQRARGCQTPHGHVTLTPTVNQKLGVCATRQQLPMGANPSTDTGSALG